mgnify:FL=1
MHAPFFVYILGRMTNTADAKLLEILVCPLTHVPLRYDEKAQELISDQAGLAFPIRDGIPVMLVDEARALEGSEIKK